MPHPTTQKERTHRMKQHPTPPCIAVIVAGGSGARMEQPVNKIFLDVCGIPVLAHTLMAFEQSALIDDIVIVTRECDIVDCKAVCDDFGISKLTTIVTGGVTRQESVQKGLAEVAYDDCIVAIHDAARCVITPEQIDDIVGAVTAPCVGAAQPPCVGAAPGVPCKDSLKRVDSAGNIAATIEREGVWQVQTPQVFRRADIAAAHDAAARQGAAATDDCELAERFGISVKMVMGSYANIKITTPEDLRIAETLIGMLPSFRA